MLIIICALTTIVMMWMGYFILSQKKQLLSMDERVTYVEKSQDQIVKDHSVLINADLLFARQMKEINAQLISMDYQIQGLENKRGNDGGYQHALRILEMGGDREEIMNSCHLSSAEADLLINLQAYRSAMKSSMS